MSLSVIPKPHNLFRLRNSAITILSTKHTPKPFLKSSLQHGNKFHTPGRWLHPGQNPPKRYFPPPTQSLWQGFLIEFKDTFRTLNLVLIGLATAYWGYTIYTHIEPVPETDRKRLNLLFQKELEEIGQTMYGAQQILAALLALEKAVSNEDLTKHDEELHRVDHILQRLLGSNGYDPRNWNVCILDIPLHTQSDSLTSTMNRVQFPIILDLKTLSSYSDDDELAFLLARQLAISKIQPKIEPCSILKLLLSIPCMFLSRTVRKHKIMVPVFATAVNFIAAAISLKLSSRDIDCLGMKIMARAGYDPKAAIEIAKKENSVLYSGHNMVNQEPIFRIHLKNKEMERRVKTLEERLPDALALRPATNELMTDYDSTVAESAPDTSTASDETATDSSPPRTSSTNGSRS